MRESHWVRSSAMATGETVAEGLIRASSAVNVGLAASE